MPFLKGTPPYMLSNTISEKQKKDSQFYALKCKIQECKQQISFFTEMLNNPKASIESQRKCLYYIEGEEIIMSKLESQIKQFEQI
jgi:hypothetical protein